MSGAGSTDLKRHMAGMDLTAMQAIRAKCADCTANYADGRISCELKECPLFPYMPYNEARRVSGRGKLQARVIGVQAGENAGKEAVESALGC